jgi:hypothetical protein
MELEFVGICEISGSHSGSRIQSCVVYMSLYSNLNFMAEAKFLTVKGERRKRTFSRPPPKKKPYQFHQL